MQCLLLSSIALISLWVGFSQANSAGNSSRRRLAEMHRYIEPPQLDLTGTEHFKVILVYFGYIYPQREHWLDIIKQQLDEFNCNGLAKRLSKIYISLATEAASESNKETALLVNTTIDAIRNIHPDAIFDITLENRFEYPGIRRIWDYAQNIASDDEARNTIILYTHSKGMINTYLSNFHAARVPLEIKLFHATFDRWDEALRMFARHGDLSKAGCLPSHLGGNIWFNMFYVRASYVQRLVNPTIAKDRFYYEHWLKFLDNERYWPRVAHIEFAEHNVYRPSTTNAGCADCWSPCQGAGNETLGVTWPPERFPYATINQMDWLRCRETTALPRTDSHRAYSTNNYFTEQT